MAGDKLRIGIIGMGGIAVISHIPQFRETGKAEIVAASRRDAERLAMAQKAFNIPQVYTDWREMLEKEDLDAVIVCTPNYYHTEPTLAALERGLHVLVEKPMAMTSKDAWAMVDAAEKADRVLMVGYGTRCFGKWRSVKQFLLDGALGVVRQIMLSFCIYRRWFWNPELAPEDVKAFINNISSSAGLPIEFFEESKPMWYADPTKAGGGLFIDNGTYYVDRSLWFGGAPATEIVAFAENAGMPADCFVNVQARLANGILVSITSANAVPQTAFRGENQMMIIGDQGILIEDRDGLIWLLHEGKREKVELGIPNLTVGAAFVSTILEGGENLAPATDAAYAVAFIEAAYRSANEGAIINIE